MRKQAGKERSGLRWYLYPVLTIAFLYATISYLYQEDTTKPIEANPGDK
jgi:hypothetical protein